MPYVICKLTLPLLDQFKWYKRNLLIFSQGLLQNSSCSDSNEAQHTSANYLPFSYAQVCPLSSSGFHHNLAVHCVSFFQCQVGSPTQASSGDQDFLSELIVLAFEALHRLKVAVFFLMQEEGLPVSPSGPGKPILFMRCYCSLPFSSLSGETISGASSNGGLNFSHLGLVLE